MQINKNERWLVYTNILFLIPIIISKQNQYWNLTTMLVITTIFSILHHTFKKPGSEWWWHTENRNFIQTFLLLSEIISAFILALWSFILLVQKSYLFISLALILFIPSFIMFLSTNYKKYVLYHSIWHITSVIIITLALI